MMLRDVGVDRSEGRLRSEWHVGEAGGVKSLVWNGQGERQARFQQVAGWLTTETTPGRGADMASRIMARTGEN